jgi:hypothetical protein
MNEKELKERTKQFALIKRSERTRCDDGCFEKISKKRAHQSQIKNRKSQIANRK